MRRQIIILCCILALGVGGIWADGIDTDQKYERCEPCEPTCTELTWECEGPPWSGSPCEYYTCGTGYMLGYVTGGWAESAIELVIHSTGGVELLFTWIDTGVGEQLGSRSITVESGNYSLPFGRLLRDIFDIRDTPHIGAIQFSWRACGDSFIYAEGWTERTFAARRSGNGQRAALRNEILCPGTLASWKGVCLPCAFTVDSCYEVMIPPDIGFVRSHFVSTSDTDWQVLYVDGHRVEVPPLLPEWPEGVEFNFIPSKELIEVCIGREDPWSGGLEISDACVISNFEAEEQSTRRKLSIPARPKLIFE